MNGGPTWDRGGREGASGGTAQLVCRYSAADPSVRLLFLLRRNAAGGCGGGGRNEGRGNVVKVGRSREAKG